MPDSIKHANSVQQFKYKYMYLEWNNDTFLSVIRDVFMHNMSRSICKHCTCMLMYIFEEMTSGKI